MIDYTILSKNELLRLIIRANDLIETAKTPSDMAEATSILCDARFELSSRVGRPDVASLTKVRDESGDIIGSQG